ncbi:hypothetical protein [Flavobacterium terrisoli]|uniref:hypothetical protein n=1 Tax=Flavobacterium terrisoli TaxID=3242195 RepID=UPI002542EA45|nr:hypothetical protein [Flavobacterium buctense]
METEVTFEWKALLFIFVVLLILSFIILLLVVPVKMANRRGRSAFVWFLVSLLISPFLSMLFLYLLGETDEKKRELVIEDERLRNQYRNPVTTNSESNFEIWLKENPGKTINDYYRNK